MLALLTLSCTQSIEQNTEANLDETAAMVLTQNAPNDLHLRACIVLSDRVVILPKEKEQRAVIVKNYDPLLIVLVTVTLTLLAVFFIIAILIASYGHQ
jgi:hypothetical protein